ncbi:hybrid PKS-NRPS PsoA [Xylariaceae sp. FL0255]|nr:hybrid PKS-NRPS PsoA [Xylariaceae sp. FL0255]
MGERRKFRSEPVAIIGTSCRLPGGTNSPSKLWELLKKPVDLLTDIPHTRFNPDAFYHKNAEHPGTTNVTKAYLLQENPLTFDNDFFGISAREAESMDPQQRILLEIAYEAIESAGYSISQLRGSSTGVFVGQMSDDYRDLILRDMDSHPIYTGTGIARSILANRVSYAFDWRGPSVNVDTACSSSLVALHQAVQSLRNEECDIAVVAGVNLVFSPELFSFLSSLRMLSPTGRSRMWDINADGYARGEGFAAIVIKSLGKALADGDDIESVIRNTGINQDGRSAGLTVPSSDAQAELMRATYARCGLDCLKEEDRCQYFEAHGTGTSAGDPKEAQGIHATFFPDPGSSGRPIHVGSIKTVVGHTEGTAGLASILKASQAVRYGLIPPNLHFERLNPDIEPFYRGLEVPTSLKPWPVLPPGASRRASVNSFGFGGANAHIIIESWGNETAKLITKSPPPFLGPYVLSAHSKTSLEAAVNSLLEKIESDEDIDLESLAWTLQTRRTQFKYRAAFSASTREELVSRLQFAIKHKEESPLPTASKELDHPRILGVFTGQGAQWATMGASLYQHSICFRQTFQRLDSVLKNLNFAPPWSLAEELLRHDDHSRISTAEISQPLCTALQIALVDLLRECGVTFSAVVGHSSGEIGAAYAAGVLEAEDAILIAFFRGLHCSQRAISNPGKMMAVGMTPEDAENFCCQPQFEGRIIVASKNSNSSCTLSGDGEAIEEAEIDLKDRSVFARILRTDMAYHSHHMKAIRNPYINLLEQSNIRPRRNCFGGSCNWYSSVYESGELTATVPFDSTYWADNLTNPVLFANAVASAIKTEDFDLALEIGPHPALKGPATETMRDVSGNAIPYHGLLERKKDAVDVFTNALGFIWRNINSPVPPVNFTGFRRACDGPTWAKPRILKDLPPYQWDHERPMLKESMKSKAWRTREGPFHELLGYQHSSGSKENRWRNILRLSDLEWLQGHQFQNQVLLPASGYLVMATQAALQLFKDEGEVQLVELQDVIIHNGITLEEGSPGVDMEFTIRAVESGDMTEKAAKFSCRCRNADAETPEFDKEVVTGRVVVVLGPPSEHALPQRVVPTLPMTDVATDRFYTWMEKIGLRYSEPFVLESIKRRLDLSTVTTTHAVSDSYKIHPGTLDTILQGLYAAFSYPGDGRVWTTFLPKSFHRVRLNMHSCRQTDSCVNSNLVADCSLTDSSAREILGDIDVFCATDGHAEIQAEGVVLCSLEVPNELNDRSMFWKTVWKPDLFSAIDLEEEASAQQMSSSLGGVFYEICERTAYFYLKKLLNEVKIEDIPTKEWQFKYLMDWARNSTDLGPHGERHPLWKASWDEDTLESVTDLKTSEYDGQIDLELIHHLGARLPAIVRGSELALQVLRTDGMIDKLYSEGFGVPETNSKLGMTLDYLAHQHPRLRVLEIGAGTGGSTGVALDYLGDKFEEYTFTDISPGYFPAAQTRFRSHEELMQFKVLDIERSPVEQGFEPHSYDVVIAAHVLHATRSIAQTLQHCRELLRPGGYLILVEITNPDLLRVPFMFAPLPGWWLGHDDRRSARPTLTEAEWDAALSRNAFSGVDKTFRDCSRGNSSMHSFSVMVSQALDDQVGALREPLSQARDIAQLKQLLIVGGRTLAVSKIATKINSILGPFAERTIIANRLEEVLDRDLKYGSAVVCLCGLEEATFKRMDPRRVSAMQSLLREAKYMLWAIRGSRDSDPYANITVGIGRSASRELAHLRLKFVDFDEIQLRKAQPNAFMLSEMLLQMVCLDLPRFEGVLWPNETEVAVENNVVLIPRVMCDTQLNDWMNCERRRISHIVNPLSTTVKVAVEHDRPVIVEQGRVEPVPERSFHADVLASSLFSFVAEGKDSDPFYICLVNSTVRSEEPRRMLALSKINSSTVESLDCQLMAECDDNNISADESLSLMLSDLIYLDLVDDSQGTVWIHNAEGDVAERIYTIAVRQDIRIFVTTSDASSGLVSSGRATYIHSRSADRDLRSLIPRNTRRFIDMGAQPSSKLATFASSSRIDVRTGIQQAQIGQPFKLFRHKGKVAEFLHNYQPYAQKYDLSSLSTRQIIKADQLEDSSTTFPATTVVSWTGVRSIQAQLSPPTRSHLFADQKTYFLIGLAGDVGLSLCNWMAGQGARFLAIASRKPDIPSAFLNHLEKKGVKIGIFTLDIADMNSLKSVRQEIESTMPPIAGVANAALVVRDHPFEGMSFEDLEAVFKPKVVGTQNLDDLFYSTPLDFFILFSSIASIVGKPAQSSYNAANLFMATMAAKRRKRGLAASVMHFGMLLGFGFIHGQAGPTTEARFRADDLPAIPEPAFHHIFAQAIVSGRPGSGLSPEVTAGLGTEIDTPWRAIPRFGHCHIKSDRMSSKDKAQGQEQSTQGIQDQLRLAGSSENARAILTSAVSRRVSMAVGSSGDGIDETVSLVSLGLDSLVAVEVRSWLLKILEVDIPVLKFLSGSSLQDICYEILGKLSNSLKPSESGSGDSDGKQPTTPTEAEVSAQVTREEPLPKSSHKVPAFDLMNPKLHHLLEPITESDDSGYVSEHTNSEYERIGDMSHSQAQLYFLHEYLQNNAYNVAYSGTFHGKLDIYKLRKALFVVGRRHEALRSAYMMDMATARPVQAVLSDPRILLVSRTAQDQSELKREVDGVKDFKFEIEKGIVMKVTVISHTPSFHSILFSHHHIALDGISWSVFIADLAKAYSKDLNGMPPIPGTLQSIDLAKKHLGTLTRENLREDLAFWKDTYKIIPEPLPLFPFAKVKTRPAVKDYGINVSEVRLPATITKLVEKAAAKVGVTSFHFYLATFAAFLNRCLGTDDIAIGIVDANRTEQANMNTIGYFLNILPARIQLNRSESFDTVARTSRDAALAAITHSRAPIDMVIGELELSRAVSHHPIFQVAINYRKAPLNETDFGADGKIQWDGAVPGGNPYDLFLNVAATSDWTYISLITQKNLYESTDGALMLKWYTRALEGLAHDPSCQIGRCPLANDADVNEAVELGRGDGIDVPWKGTLTDRVDKMIAASPDDIAIKDDQGTTLTYAHMKARMLQITHGLRVISPPLTRGSYVGMLLDPAADAVCCILAILRLGLVWIPLDTRNHHGRLRSIVDESKPCALICHGSTRKLAQQVAGDLQSTQIVSIDDMTKEDAEDGTMLPASQGMMTTESDISIQPAMLLYTSGSTGVPKGVLLTHGGLTNQIYGTTAQLGLRRETTLQQSPLGFDLMLDQIFLALCNGGTIIMVGKAGRGDPIYLAELMVQHGVTLTHFVPSEYLALLNYGHHILAKTRSWRYAMSGGEKLGRELRGAFRKLDCGDGLQLVNVYGPAEITLACARGIVPYREDTDDSYRDYLQTSPNYGLEITGSESNILPVGFPGEICITGRGVGLGYLNRIEESAKKFTTRGSLRIYRSGDFGRLLPDGTLKVLGRLDGDSQVKINGFRVELDEIANAIVHQSNGKIVNAAASYRSGQPSGTLVAFVVFDTGLAKGDKHDFLQELRSNVALPPYMKPRFIIPIDRIPATANGKTDRRAIDQLPISDTLASKTNGEVTHDLTPAEQSMKEVWEEVLSSQAAHKSLEIRPASDFFEVGGTSILMIKLKSLLEAQGAKISMPDLFHSSTLGSMAGLLATATAAVIEEPHLTTTATSATAPASSSFLKPKGGIQQRINWDLEIASLTDGLPQPSPASSLSSAKKFNGGLEIILTGATGFIGRHLLARLIQDPKVQRVHCIAIRPSSSSSSSSSKSEDIAHRLLPLQSPKIIAYAGDLADLALGLTAAQITHLSQAADAIIHNGADVSLLKTYRTLRRANVLSTRTLIADIAGPRGLPVHYISTASVVKVIDTSSKSTTGALLEVPAYPPVPELLDSVDGYAATKWASETLLDRACASSSNHTVGGITGYVHRLAHVVGSNASELDAIGMLTKYALALKKLPFIHERDVEGVWDFVDIEDVVRDIVGCVHESISTSPSSSCSTSGTRFINHCSDVKVAHTDLKKYLEAEAASSSSHGNGGKGNNNNNTKAEPFEEVSMREWLDGAKALGMHPLVHDFFVAFDEGRGKMILPVMARGIPPSS